MNRSYFYQFICKPLRNRVISKVIPLLPAIMICFQLSPALCADFTGNWSGTWRSYDGDSGGLSGNITQTGTSLTGTMSVTNTGCGNFPNVPLTGSVSGDVATFQGHATCHQDGSYNELKFTNGTILGNTMTGTYTINRNYSYWGSGTFSLTRPDTTPPTVTITSPTSNPTYSTSSSPLSIGGTASDNVGVTQVKWSNHRGGSGTASGTTSWSVSGKTLYSGQNIITVTARDAAGNTGTDTLTVTYTPPDTISPTIQITSPTSNPTYSTTQATINIGGTASDYVGVTQVTWANNRGGSGTASGTTSWSVSGITLYSGQNIITVTARDAAGNTGSDTLTVTYTPPVFNDDFSTDKGWIGYESGGWERSPALAGGGEYGNPDPTTDHSPTSDNYILGFAIGADYSNNLTEKSIISPPIDCTGRDEVFLKFRRWLNVEGNEFDHARIYVSNNGADWIQVWENPPIDLMDNQWVPAVLDISSVAANQGTVYIKFTMGPTNSSRPFSGWNIDDFELTSEAICPSEGTMGTEILITGFGFGTKKGKVFIGGIALKVLEWADDFIHAVLSKPIDPAVYDVTIQLSGPKGTPSIIEKDGFAVKAAEIHSVEQGEGSAYDQVTIKGKFFGTKKGAVYLEYGEGENLIRKSCKVNSWTMDPTTGDSEILFVVPKMLPEVCDVVVDPYSTIAETEEEDGFSVKAPEIESVDPKTGSVGDEVTISGKFFGSKKGKVYLGYVNVKNGNYAKKSCSVSSWPTDPTKEKGEIVFTVPKLPLGTYDVIVTNSVGSDTVLGGFIIK